MRTDPLPRLVLIGLTTLSIIACSSAAMPPTPASPSSSSPSSPSSPSSMPGTSEEPAVAWLLVGRRGEPDLHLVLATTGEVAMDIPDGSPRSHWDRIVTATADGAATIVRDIVVQPGFGGPELRIDGHWRLPTVGLDPIPAGRSLDGSTIALVERAYDPSAGVSRFAIVDHFLLDAVQTAGDAPLRLVRVIELRGAFEYDTLSPDGRILYVVQHLDGEAGGHYQVRAVDVPTGLMRNGVIVDKTHPDETMAGSPVAQVRRPDGLVLTLYRGPEHPFIHALASMEAWAVCIDLPVGDAHNPDAGLDWGLAPSADGSSVFAVNASLRLVVEIDPTGLAVRRSASIGSSAAAPIVLAKFGHGDVGPVGRRLVVSPDGTMLFAAGADGISAIRTRDLAAVRHDLAGSAIDSVGITPDGRVLFALVRGGTIVALDAATGRDLGTVPGNDYDRLLAVAPW
ncbi:MAG TPA: hypothetical protein VHM48_10060 [Candidatus Limnocylindrales bacterium]|nr:hypothetical protein [Candidatus Limnocylindrales bacterium]